jgi:hypothetical protein
MPSDEVDELELYVDPEVSGVFLLPLLSGGRGANDVAPEALEAPEGLHQSPRM